MRPATISQKSTNPRCSISPAYPNWFANASAVDSARSSAGVIQVVLSRIDYPVSGMKSPFLSVLPMPFNSASLPYDGKRFPQDEFEGLPSLATSDGA
jgi:hypothetical protein